MDVPRSAPDGWPTVVSTFEVSPTRYGRFDSRLDHETGPTEIFWARAHAMRDSESRFRNATVAIRNSFTGRFGAAGSSEPTGVVDLACLGT